MTKPTSILPVSLLVSSLALLPSTAHAYIGPGGGLSAIGIFLALMAGVVAAVFGFLWFPLKRYLARRRGASGEANQVGE